LYDFQDGFQIVVDFQYLQES